MFKHRTILKYLPVFGVYRTVTKTDIAETLVSVDRVSIQVSHVLQEIFVSTVGDAADINRTPVPTIHVPTCDSLSQLF